MSDTTVAPQGSAPPAAPATSAPTPQEVAINTNQTSQPNPVGSQAPPAPEGDIKGSQHRTPSRREAIQAAFERANNPTQPSRHTPKEAKPAEAKAGHNNPPEATEKLDLKKRPQPNAAVPDGPDARPRDKGRFVSRETAGAPAAASQAGIVGTPGHAQNAQNAKSVHKPLPGNAPFREPPIRMSEQAKVDWHGTPETVRGDIHRIQGEFAKAYQAYKGAYDTMKPIERFVKMAKDHGTNLEAALTNYTGMEAKLRADPIAGLELIVHNLGLTTKDEQGRDRPATFRDVAYTVLSQSPEQMRLTQQSNNMGAAAHQIGALHQEVVGLKNSLQQMHTQRQFEQNRSAIDSYADSHPRLDELSDLIKQEIELGFDLDTAYRRAELLRPATHAAQTRTTSAQTRPADRSIHGSPDSVSNGASRSKPREPSRSPREAIERAVARSRGAY